jgi:probable F420-dependent oxidoreductase
MRVDTSLRRLAGGGRGLLDVADGAHLAESLGFDGLIFGEIRTDPLLDATLAITATGRLEVATNVLIAFPRSPMVVAYATRNLQELSGGRFTLGIGTQVRGHITRRFSATWDSPGPRLREYVQSLRAIWDCWQNGTPLEFRGRFYSFTLMTPEFNLGPSDYPTRVNVAAVNPFNVATAAMLCDGLTLHSLLTRSYLDEVIWPAVRRGAASVGRQLDNFEISGSSFLVWGPTAEAVALEREAVRRRVAFYSSTPAYAPVLEHHGLHALGPKLRALIAEKRWDDLASLIDDDVLDLFCITGVYEEIPEKIQQHLGGLVDRIHLSLPRDASEAERQRVKRTLDALREIADASARRRESTTITALGAH